jgi:hypothetical protein
MAGTVGQLVTDLPGGLSHLNPGNRKILTACKSKDIESGGRDLFVCTVLNLSEELLRKLTKEPQIG